MSIAIAVRTTYRTFAAIAVKEFGVTDSCLSIARTLAFNGPCSQARIAEIARLDPAAVSRQLVQLQRDGLVTRRPSPHHKRAVIAALSRKGEAWFAKVTQRREELEGVIAEDVSDADLATTIRVLQKLDSRAGLLLSEYSRSQNASQTETAT